MTSRKPSNLEKHQNTSQIWSNLGFNMQRFNGLFVSSQFSELKRGFLATETHEQLLMVRVSDRLFPLDLTIWQAQPLVRLSFVNTEFL